MGKLLTTIIVVAGILSAFYVYIPVPEDLENPWVFRLLGCLVRCMHWIMYYEVKYTDVSSGLFADRLQFPMPENNNNSLTVTTTEFDGVRVILFQPNLPTSKEDQLLPAIVYFHGGGFVLGNPDIMYKVTQRMCVELQAVVASVDYRLAPKYKFPAAFEDSLKATKWLLTNAKKYSVDARKVAIAGDSAGGLLSAAVSQFIKDDLNVPNLLFQALIYPTAQQIDVNLPSTQQYHAIFGNRGIVCKHDMAMFIGLYAFGEFRQDYYDAFMTGTLTSREFRETSELMQYIDHDVILKSGVRSRHYVKPTSQTDNSKLWHDLKDVLLDVRMSPLLRKDMSGLPPAWIATCEYDPIRDDGILYAHRLKNDGVHVSFKNYEKGFHGAWMSEFNLVVYNEMMTDFMVFAKEYIKPK
ncbi:neutral cholesterol ester hydrolase 1-like [Antedon mediterranea]|uniref:neutral cholesterol ester hydrolase 1-like n=1 Tax=Antedon mediterranea TaxID=105859 RepID=UPI003AF6A3D5